MQTNVLVVVALALLGLGGCPQMADPTTDPNLPADETPTTTPGTPISSGGDPDDDDFVGPQPPGTDEPDEPTDPANPADPNAPAEPNTPADEDATTRDLRVNVTLFNTGAPASGATVTVRQTGIFTEELCNETTTFTGQVTCPGLPPGLYTVTATLTDGFGLPTTASTQVLITAAGLPPVANVVLTP